MTFVVCRIGKTSYPTKSAASKARAVVKRGNRARVHGELQVYRCPTCGGFHIGHRSRKAAA